MYTLKRLQPTIYYSGPKIRDYQGPGNITNLQAIKNTAL